MNFSTTIPATVHIRRGRLFGLVGAVAAFAAAITWAVLAFGVDTAGSESRGSVPAESAVLSSPIPMTGYLDGITSKPSVTAPQAAVVPRQGPPGTIDPAVMPARGVQEALEHIYLGTTFPRSSHGLTRESVLSSLSPKSRRYVETLMGLTYEQLAAGAAGSP